MKGRSFRMRLFQNGNGNVEDRDLHRRFPLRGAVVGVSVKSDGDAEPIEWTFEAARAEERQDLERLAFDRLADGGVMQKHHPSFGMESRERLFEANGVVNRLLHERFDARLTPCIEHPFTKATAESGHTGKANPLNLRRFAVEHDHADLFHDVTNLVHVTRFEIVITENRKDRNMNVDAQIFREQTRLLGKTVVGEITAKKQDIGRLRCFRQERRVQMR